MKSREHIVPVPESNASKKEQISSMFDSIAPKYDLLNRVLSLGIDKSWRRKAVKSIRVIQPQDILDVATGTGDFALMTASVNPKRIVGIDISEGMLKVGKEKVKRRNMEDVIKLEKGDSEQIHYSDNTFDAVTCAYGVRNFENLDKGLQEMCRVMRPGGRLAILEFSKPKSFPFKNIYNFYFNSILPRMGRSVSKDNSAYKYLPDSVKAFPDGRDFLDILESCGFKNVDARPLSMGITTLYTATK